MVEIYCVKCGYKRIRNGKFCANCGDEFEANDTSFEVMASAGLIGDASPAPVINTNQEKRKSVTAKTWPNVLVNICMGIALINLSLLLERQVDLGGGRAYINQTIIIIIFLQVLSVFLQRRKKSASVSIPIIIAFISIFPTLAMYKDFQEWLYYQGYNTQSMANGDLVIIAECFVLYLAVVIVNLVFSIIPSKKLKK